MSDEASAFSLVTEPWIPVMWRDGATERLGLAETMRRAHEVRGIVAPNPMDRVAILRFLLAVLYWCRGNPDDGATWEPDAPLPSGWFTKIEEERARLNLLGDGPRFMQTQGITRQRPVTDLMLEIPSGNNFRHFRHVTDYDAAFCPACCAVGLLRLPLFATSGLPDLKAGINGTPPIYALWLGETLADTLQVNWRPATDVGRPIWEQPRLAETTGPVPLLHGMTVPARRAWLKEAVAEPTACTHCGATSRRTVRECLSESAGELKSSGWTDPHVVYTMKSARGQGAPADQRVASTAREPMGAGKFITDKAWYEVVARMAENGCLPSKRLHQRLLLVGLATNKAAGVDVWEREIQAPTAGDGTEAAGRIRAWAESGRGLARGMGRAKALSKAITVTIGPHAEHGSIGMLPHLDTDGAPQRAAVEAERGRMVAACLSAVAAGCTVAERRRRRSTAGMMSRPATGSEPTGPTAAFIAGLGALGASDLAALRNHATERPDHTVEGFDLFTGLWWPLRQRYANAPRREVAWLVAKLYAYLPLDQRASATLSAVLGRERGKGARRIEEGLDALLAAPLTSIEPHLRWALRAVEARSDGLDWVRLTDDLSRWEDRAIRRQWADDYLFNVQGGR